MSEHLNVQLDVTCSSPELPRGAQRGTHTLPIGRANVHVCKRKREKGPCWEGRAGAHLT